jgi:hypothetical protein
MDFLIGDFDDPEAAAIAVVRLVDESFPTRDITMVAAEPDGPRPVRVETRTCIPEGAASGGVIGGAVGGVGAALAASGAIAAPALGLAAGPAMAGLQGAMAGAALGGLMGTMAGLGVWKTRPPIEEDEETVGEERIWVGVSAPGPRAEEAERILREAGANAVKH